MYVLARPGKPTEATITLVYFIYESGFRFFRMGSASAAVVDPVPHRRRPDDRLLPVAAALGPLPVSAGRCAPPQLSTAARGRAAGAGRGTIGAPLGAYAVLIAGGLLMMMPFFWMLLTSLKTRAEVFGSPPLSLPSGPHCENYETDVERASGTSRSATFFLNSLKIATADHDRRGVRAARSRRSRSRCSRSAAGGLLFALLMATLIIPFQVVLVPNFILCRTLPNPFSDSGNCIGTQEPLWVGAFLGGAFGIFLLRQFFLAIPSELADAARVDGANPWHIFRRIYLPLARPALATLAIFTFMWTWNDLHHPADLPARPRPVHDDRRASRSSRASSWASGRR